MSKRPEDLDDDTRDKALRFVSLMADVGYPVQFVFTLRTFDEQDGLYEQGRTTPGPKVTKVRGGYSWHNFGRAFDFCFAGRGYDVPDDWWKLAGLIGERLGLFWGGRDGIAVDGDFGHFENPQNETRTQLREAMQNEARAV